MAARTNEHPDSPPRLTTGPLVVTVLCAVLVRLAVSWTAWDAPAVADMEQYHARGLHLLRHAEFGPDALRGPGYLAVLAAVYAVAGESLSSARIANALIGGVLAALTGLLALQLGAGRRAWIAAAVVAFYPGLVLSSTYVMPDTLCHRATRRLRAL